MDASHSEIPSSLAEDILRILDSTEADRETKLENLLAVCPPTQAAAVRGWLAKLDTIPNPNSPRVQLWQDPPYFGAYRILARLGAGGMGCVYLAEDTHLKRRVALKVIRSDLLSQPDVQRRFDRETVAASRLDHPNICHVYEVGRLDGQPYMTMQWIRGETLAQRIASARKAQTSSSRRTLLAPRDPRARLRPRKAALEVVALMEKVARAVHAAHDAGLIHRDIKPGNIMLTDEHEPVVLDFGLATDEILDPAAMHAQSVVGTPLYMAPEQMRPQGRTIDRRADVYALGVTLYECLTLEHPYTPVDGDLLTHILTRTPVSAHALNPAIPADLATVVSCAMDRDRTRRYGTAAALAEDLRRIRAREPILARPAGPLRRAARWIQRHPAPTTVIVVLVSALATILHFWSRAADVTDRFVDLAGVLHAVRTADQTGRPPLPLWPVDLITIDTWFRDHAERRISLLPQLRSSLDRVGAPDSQTLGDDHDLALQRMRSALSSMIIETEQFESRDLGRAQALRARVLEQDARTEKAMAASRDAWVQATTAIATSPTYRGLRLPAQRGLIPLGQNSDSGLWEFLHVASSASIARRPIPGHPDPQDGVVLILVPPGTSSAGPAATGATEALDPFFIGKHEITQAQWMRLGDGSNPSSTPPGALHSPVTVTLLHPVESVTWAEALRVLRGNDLDLPTEAEWEVAARGGVSTAWYTGDDPATLAGHANVLDLTALTSFPEWDDVPEGFSDGYALHAPIGHYRPNLFGLYDVHGNVAEWMLDSYSRIQPQPAHGISSNAGSTDQTVRGGDFRHSSAKAKCSARFHGPASSEIGYIGIRPARRVQT